jgi:uracil-DNA glycosylase
MVENLFILDYQQKCYREYIQSIDLPEPYTFPDGNPIRPLPPVQVAPHSLMIIGAYPSARFESRPSHDNPNRYRLIPVANNLQPFGDEQYFDGTRVRTLPSAVGLREYLLSKLQLHPQDCWITDTVKVFLYKPEHIDSCKEVHPEFQVLAHRKDFIDLAKRSLPWLEEECEICQPKLILTLGEEVAQVISGDRTASADDLLSREIIRPEILKSYPTLFLPHPEACRRLPKWRDNMEKRIELIQQFLKDNS